MALVMPFWFEVVSCAVLALVLIVDLLVVVKRPHVPSVRESALWVAFYVALALLFAFLVFVFADAEHAGQFMAGWITEYSLSVDNLFVFLVIMTRFAVPPLFQPRVLMVGIIIALVLRGIFIILGAQLIAHFSWIFYLFGVFLIVTAWHQVVAPPGTEAKKDNRLIRFLRRRFRIANEFDGMKIRTITNGRRYFTPMLVVFAAIGSTDMLFALDSIPAIFGITQSPFIVFTANVFALMGLRQLYFLLGGLLDRLTYLRFGIAFVLAFIGVKLMLHALHMNELPFINGGQNVAWMPDIDTWTSLTVIIVSMTVATVASLIKMRVDRKRSVPMTPTAADPPPHEG
jgi:tellurite resistance protein TerC